MSAQIQDRLLYNRTLYYLIATTNDDFLFNPKEHGLHPSRLSTACWRGYWLIYFVSDNRSLSLERLYINCPSRRYPQINGKGVVSKDWDKMSFDELGFSLYDNLNIVYNNYTGRILLGDKLLVGRGYVRRTGFRQPYYAYENVIELIFRNGILIDTIDHSELVKKVRVFQEKAIEEKGDKDDAYILRNCGRYTTHYFRTLPENELKKYWWIKFRDKM